jgi:hypothetical protein
MKNLEAYLTEVDARVKAVREFWVYGKALDEMHSGDRRHFEVMMLTALVKRGCSGTLNEKDISEISSLTHEKCQEVVMRIYSTAKVREEKGMPDLMIEDQKVGEQ